MAFNPSDYFAATTHVSFDSHIYQILEVMQWCSEQCNCLKIRVMGWNLCWQSTKTKAVYTGGVPGM